MGKPIGIFMVDDLRLLREGLVSLLMEAAKFTVICRNLLAEYLQLKIMTL